MAAHTDFTRNKSWYYEYQGFIKNKNYIKKIKSINNNTDLF